MVLPFCPTDVRFIARLRSETGNNALRIWACTLQNCPTTNGALPILDWTDSSQVIHCALNLQEVGVHIGISTEDCK